jgi:hypothetical protein
MSTAAMNAVERTKSGATSGVDLDESHGRRHRRAARS